MLLALMCWAAVTANCDGGPESSIRYVHKVAYQSIIGTQPCDYDDDGNPVDDGACPVYALTPFTVARDGADPCAPVPVPGPGECAFLLTTAFDEADNADCGG